MRRLGPCFLLLGVFLVVARANAKELTSPKNFKLTYPDEWTVATPDESATIAAKTKELAPGASEQATTIFGPKEEKFTPNVSIVVTLMALPINDETARAFVKNTEAGLDQAGFKMRVVKTSRMKVSDSESLSIAMEGSVPGVSEPARQWMVVVPGRTRTYIVTCSASKARWASTVPSFDAMIKSLRVDIRGFKGGLLSSTKGFSLKYPNGWAAASVEQLAAFPATPKPAAVLVGPPEKGVSPSLFVTIAPGNLRIDEKDEGIAEKFAKGYTKAFGKAFAEKGIELAAGQGSWIHVGKLSAISVTFDLSSDQSGKAERQWHVIIPAKQQGYVVVCTATASRWAKLAPVFKTMVNSLKIDLEEPK